ncbi:metalloregulator ArsR/SmtB family transcription factor [Yinghuangia sp. ASG 101]|uniref:ArsR/SmtB family transcription factor n=1 Tax=Yinghuangia sp. ASG 101 TaxID=2896848 RepID=UPI001E2A3F53|nr:metalloregulator ArsR/SmtB family transcription factor [Yinghuangia sp. ASG 101]UGQ10459.1 metalloregulator ArsR/SmtB family transcription factor [Yinghuangia sp. ASG 101]
MKDEVAHPRTLDADTAATYAAWFKALADPTRIRLVNLLAVERRPMSVGEIVERSEVGQSTVSHHLKLLAEVRFVLADKRGTATYYHVNENCLSCFPSAADAVMGHAAPDPSAVPCEEPP